MLIVFILICAACFFYNQNCADKLYAGYVCKCWMGDWAEHYLNSKK